MANTVFKLRRSSVAGKQPNTSTLAIGELALNLTDRKLYSSDGTNVWETGANLTTLSVSTNTSVNNVIVSGGIYANGSFGTSGQVLTSNSSGVYWSSSSAGGVLPFYGQYTGDGSTTSFAVAGGYTPNYISVYLNGVLLRNGSEVDITSGINVVITPAPPNGSLIDVVGVSAIYTSGVSSTVSQQFTANGTANSFAITGGYLANQVQVFLNGVKQIPGTDVNLTSGANVNFITTPSNGFIIDVYGYQTSVSLSSSILTVGANITISSNTITVGNSSVNTQIVAGNVFLNGSTLVIGNTVSNVTINSTAVSVSGQAINSTNYQTSSGLSANVAVLTANNTSFVGSVSAANVVSNAQLSANLSNYALLSGATFSGDVIMNGNLTVSGTTVSVNVATLDVKDKNITVAKGSTASASDGAGITVDGSNIGWYYTYSSNAWTSNVGIIPSSNVSFNLGSSGLNWSNVYSNNIIAVNLYGTLQTSSQPNITANNSSYLGGTAAASYQLNSTLGANIASYLPTYTGVVNGSSISVGTSTVSNSTGLWTTGTVNAATIQVGTSVVANSSKLVLGTAVGLQANGSIGSNGQVLTSNATTVYWANATAGATGGGSDKAFWENDITITTDYTITTNKNAMTAGPITINSGVTVTVPSGSVWTVV